MHIKLIQYTPISDPICTRYIPDMLAFLLLTPCLAHSPNLDASIPCINNYPFKQQREVICFST